MSQHSIAFLILTVALPVIIAELLLLLSWRKWGDRGAYPWYSCLLRTAAYSPCLVLDPHGLTPLPLSSAYFHILRGAGGDIIWLYGLPEVFVGVVCFLFSFGIRLLAPRREQREVGANVEELGNGATRIPESNS